MERFPLDRLGRPLRNLRVSVTDRCNLRCGYCMPEEEYTWLPRQDLLRFEEIETLLRGLVPMGISKLRLTGGEPLLRRDLAGLVERLARIDGLDDLAMTTNGLLLKDQAADLRQAGLGRLTVSLDSLDPQLYAKLTRRDSLDQALAGLEAATSAGFTKIKINTVMLAGGNDQELESLLEFARQAGHELRFIEYMDVGGATQWSSEQVLGKTEILARIEAHFGPLTPASKDQSAPADRFRLADGTTIGVIASTTQPFCSSCDRARLTADGKLFACLYAAHGLDLRTPLRAGLDAVAMGQLVSANWAERQDRGAEQRLAEGVRKPLAGPAELQANPHLEMHTKGG
ncbi:MAG: cyclic pyranopterin phosphate synthase [Planctomycetota bacterium]|jgi:cyclic pyranopterin phosphate synthase